MNKAELIAAISESTELPANDTKIFLNAFIETVTHTLSEGGTVVLPGFGTYATTVRAARTGRNPQTGEPLKIAEATLPKFKAGKGLKEACNQ